MIYLEAVDPTRKGSLKRHRVTKHYRPLLKDKQMNGLHVSRVLTFILASIGLTAAALAAAQSVKCTENENFIVIARDGPDVGSQIIVRKKSDPHAKIKCAFSPQPSDYIAAKNGDAKYVLALQGKFLILDQGTGPSPRGLSVIDLSQRKEVWSGEYYDEEAGVKVEPQGVTFWRALGEAKPAECPDYQKITAQSFTPLLVVKGTLGFSDFQFKPITAKKCVIGQ